MSTNSGSSKQASSQDKSNSNKLLQSLAPEFVISWKWLISGIVAVVFIGCGVVLCHSIQMKRMPEHIIDIAKELVNKGDQAATSGNMADRDRNFVAAFRLLRIFSEYTDAGDMSKVNNYLSDIMERMLDEKIGGNSPESMRQLIRLLNDRKAKTDDREEVVKLHERILQLCWDSRNFSDVVRESRELIAYDPNNSTAWNYLAQSLYYQTAEMGIFASANEEPRYLDQLLERALEKDNQNNIELSVLRAETLRSTNPNIVNNTSPSLFSMRPDERKTEADKIMDTMVQANTDSAKAYIARFEYRNRYNELNFGTGGLDTNLRSALSLEPDNIAAMVLAGNYELRYAIIRATENDEVGFERYRESAEKRFRDAGEINKTSVIPFLQLGEMYDIISKPNEAVKEWRIGYERLKENNGQNHELLGRLARGLIKTANTDEALNVITELQNSLHTRPSPNGTLQVQYETMSNLLLALLNYSKNPTLGKEILGDFERGLDYYRKERAENYVFAQNSIIPKILGEAFMTYGDLHMQNMQYDDAAWAYERALNIPEQKELATYALVNAWVKNNRLDRAKVVLRNAISGRPEDMHLRYRLAQITFQEEIRNPMRNWTELENEISFLMKNLPETPEQLAQQRKSNPRIPEPWQIELLNIRYRYERYSNDLDNQDNTLIAMRKIAARERSADKLRDPKNRQSALGCFSELASMFSAMSSPQDMDAALDVLKEMPDGSGKQAYYTILINDAMRRDDLEEAKMYADEAIDNFQGSTPDLINKRARFAVIKESLERPGFSTEVSEFTELDDLINQVLSDNPESTPVHPQILFEYCEKALDRQDLKTAKKIEDRLRVVEKEYDTRWKYCMARRLVIQAEDGNRVHLEEPTRLQKEIVGRRPDWDRPYLLEAFIKTKEGDAQGAITAYRMAISKGCAQPEVYDTLIQLLTDQNDIAGADEFRRLAKARNIDIESQALGSFGQPYQHYYDQIFKALRNYDLDTAERLSDDCLNHAKEQLDSEKLVLDLNAALGKLYMDNNFTENAEKYLKELAKLGGKNVYPLAVCMAKNGQVDDAFNLIINEIEKTPEDTTLLPSMLVLLSQVTPGEPVFERIDEIMQTNAKNLLERYKNNPSEGGIMESLLPLADYWIMRQNADEAIQLYDVAIEIEPKNLLALNNLAFLHAFGKQDYPKALQLIDRALNMKPEQPTLMDTKGLILVADNRIPEALPLMERACELTCEGPVFVMHYAYALLKMNDLENARRQFDQVRGRINQKRLVKEDSDIFDELSSKIPSQDASGSMFD